jgi:hypothetical protein
MSAFEHLIANLDRCWTNKAGSPMEGDNSRMREAFFSILRNRGGECALEGHQFRPIKPETVSMDPSALHPMVPVNQFGGADEHFFGITAPQCARTTERS